MSSVVLMFHGRPTQGQKRWVNARLSVEQARQLSRELVERLAELEAQPAGEDGFESDIYLHAPALICTGTAGTEQTARLRSGLVR